MNASIKCIGPEPPKLERNYKKRPLQVTGEGKYIKVLPSEYKPRPAPIPKLRKRKPKTENEHVEKVKEAVATARSLWWNEERVWKLIELHRQGLTYSRIADEMHTTKGAVSAQISRLIERGALESRTKDLEWTLEEMNRITDLRREGKTWAEVGDVFGKNATTCQEAWRRWNDKQDSMRRIFRRMDDGGLQP